MRTGGSKTALRQSDSLCVSLPLRGVSVVPSHYFTSICAASFKSVLLPSKVFCSPSSLLHLSLPLFMCVPRSSRERKRRRRRRRRWRIIIFLSPTGKPPLNPDRISKHKICLHSATFTRHIRIQFGMKLVAIQNNLRLTICFEQWHNIRIRRKKLVSAVLKDRNICFFIYTYHRIHSLAQL